VLNLYRESGRRRKDVGIEDTAEQSMPGHIAPIFARANAIRGIRSAALAESMGGRTAWSDGENTTNKRMSPVRESAINDGQSNRRRE